jgi:hypothetical protein
MTNFQKSIHCPISVEMTKTTEVRELHRDGKILGYVDVEAGLHSHSVFGTSTKNYLYIANGT